MFIKSKSWKQGHELIIYYQPGFRNVNRKGICFSLPTRLDTTFPMQALRTVPSDLNLNLFLLHLCFLTLLQRFLFGLAQLVWIRYLYLREYLLSLFPLRYFPLVSFLVCCQIKRTHQASSVGQEERIISYAFSKTKGKPTFSALLRSPKVSLNSTLKSQGLVT